MPSVIFSHTKTQEKEYLKQLLAEKEWFEREHFSVFLPKNQDDALLRQEREIALPFP